MPLLRAAACCHQPHARGSAGAMASRPTCFGLLGDRAQRPCGIKPSASPRPRRCMRRGSHPCKRTVAPGVVRRSCGTTPLTPLCTSGGSSAISCSQMAASRQHARKCVSSFLAGLSSQLSSIVFPMRSAGLRRICGLERCSSRPARG